MNGFKRQQHRWTKGSIQTCKKILPLIWKSDLSLTVKMEATAHLTSNFAYLLLVFLCILIHPASGGPDYGIARVLIFDIPIFAASTLSVAIFYLCAQLALNPSRWYRDILYLPMLLALGIGLSINNGRAVLEAIFNHQSEFKRTAKYAIGNGTNSSWKSSIYTPIRSLMPLVEMGFALYFTFFVWEAFTHGQFLSLPFLMLFQVGFAYVSFSSIIAWFPPKLVPPENPDDDAAASVAA
jgi:hypothetical protein